MLIESSTVTNCGAAGLQRRARCGRGRAGSAPAGPVTRWRAVELGRDVRGEAAAARAPAAVRSVSGVADRKLPPSAKNTCARPVVHARGWRRRCRGRARRGGGEAEARAQRGRGRRRRIVLPDAHRAIALHVAVAAHRAGARARAAEVAAQQQQVDDLLDVGDRVLVLGEAHGPAGDDPPGGRRRSRRPAHAAARATPLSSTSTVPGLGGQRRPRRPRSRRCARSMKRAVEHRPGAARLLLQHLLHDALEQRHVAVDAHRQVQAAMGGARARAARAGSAGGGSGPAPPRAAG